MSEVETAFQQVWKELYNPKSACPDVELGAVVDVLASVLANSDGFSNPSLDSTERWILAYVSIVGTTDSESLQWAAAYKVPYYSDEKDDNGYPKPRPYNEYEAKQASERDRVGSAIQSLLDSRYLKYSSGGGGKLQCVPQHQMD